MVVENFIKLYKKKNARIQIPKYTNCTGLWTLVLHGGHASQKVTLLVWSGPGPDQPSSNTALTDITS